MGNRPAKVVNEGLRFGCGPLLFVGLLNPVASLNS
jgi:hypothetical protein